MKHDKFSSIVREWPAYSVRIRTEVLGQTLLLGRVACRILFSDPQALNQVPMNPRLCYVKLDLNPEAAADGVPMGLLLALELKVR